MYEWLPSFMSFLVAIGTLGLAASVLLQMRESRKALAREIHADHLRDFLKHWREATHHTYVDGRTIYRRRHTPSDGVESSPLFGDLKEHLHSESGLMETYSKYKEYSMKFTETGYSLYIQILTDSCAKTGEKLTTESKTGLRGGYITALHEQYLTFALTSKVASEEWLTHTIEDQTTTTGRWIVRFGGHEIAAVEDESRAKSIRDAHEQMLRDFTNPRYNDLAASFVKTSRTINAEVDNLHREIDDLIAQPLFAGDCKYIQRSLTRGSRWRTFFKSHK